MGRRPTPIEERIAAGTVRPDRHARVPVVMGGRKPPVPAAYLTAAQKREFRRLVRELHGSNLLDSADRGMLELAAIEVAVVAECNRHLGDGLTVAVPHGGYNGSPEWTTHEVSPYLKMREDAVNKLRYLYRELGIGAASRASLANGGATGKRPSQMLPGVGVKPTLLKAVGGE